MFSKKEVAWVIIAIIIFGFIISLPKLSISSYKVFILAAVIILSNVIIKKITAPLYNITIEHKIWEFKRFGWYKRSKFKKPIPIGLILPFFISFLSLGIFKVMTLLQFDVKNLPKKRLLKKTGSHRYSEINETDIAFTAAWGFWVLLLLAIIGTAINQPELTKYSIYYGIWNLIPISQLDGTKLFFGSLLNWIILVIIYIAALIFVVL